MLTIVQVLDEEEIIANEEFAKLEARLEKKGKKDSKQEYVYREVQDRVLS
jgi:hypothetical protein